MKRLNLLLVLILAVTASAQQKRAVDNKVLLKLEADFARATALGGHEAFVSYFAEDGVELQNGGGIATKSDLLKEGPWPPGFSLSWTPVKAEMASSGDLGYTYGNYVLKMKGQDGTPVTRYGKYTSIWKKQKDGTWKVILDMGNTSPAPNSSKQ